MFPLVCMLFTTTSLVATGSRMSYAFARDRGLPFGHVLARVHPTLQVPLNALTWTAAWVIVFGCIFLGPSSTFNAITSACLGSARRDLRHPARHQRAQGPEDAAAYQGLQITRASRLGSQPREYPDPEDNIHHPAMCSYVR